MSLTIPVYNQKGEKVEEIELNPEIFEVKFNSDLVHQVIVSYLANQRYPWAHTKTRAEVKGGGKKPWSQKGTGRARHGSIRSPLWVGGGVTFGPRKEKNYEKKIPKKMKRKAIFCLLSQKLRDKEIFLLDKFETFEEKPKTKRMLEILKNIFKEKPKSLLLVLAKNQKNVLLSARNLPKTKIILVDSLNALDLANFKYLLMEKETIPLIEKIFLKK
ncbi:50S ribosomal protein L4 [bacterium]|nr:50S ribosomal protein L4 [bacterium]